jgi:predicted transposase/invertase (TIGR01784 family)
MLTGHLSVVKQLSYHTGVKHPGLLKDILFKIVFGSQSSEPVLRALLNALLNRTGPRTIVSLEILNPTFDKEYLAEKGAILDVKARDQTGRQYNIEVQLNPGLGDYVARSLFYSAKFFCDQLERGQPYESLCQTVTISLLDFNLFPDRTELHSTFQLREPEQGFPLTDLLELHYIELRKFSPSKTQELRTRFERWLYLLKFADHFDVESKPLPDNLAQEEGIPMAIDSMRKAYARDEIRELIEAREKAERDEISRLHHARQEGRLEGRQEGRQEGRLEGRQEGRLEGRQEMLRQLLQSGMSRRELKDRIGASDEELDQLA